VKDDAPTLMQQDTEAGAADEDRSVAQFGVALGLIPDLPPAGQQHAENAGDGQQEAITGHLPVEPTDALILQRGGHVARLDGDVRRAVRIR
jgi:hypothetical protein